MRATRLTRGLEDAPCVPSWMTAHQDDAAHDELTGGKSGMRIGTLLADVINIVSMNMIFPRLPPGCFGCFTIWQELKI